MEQIVTGTVMNNWNEEHPGKIQVSYALEKGGEIQTEWLPVMCSYAAAGYGSYVLPEVGTAVIVGFVYGSSNRPLVLGCVWSQDNPMTENAANGNNSKKRWKTKAGYELLVDEDSGHLNLNVMDKVDIAIGGEPFLTLEKGKVTFAGAVTVQAEGMTVQADGVMNLKASEDVKVSGKNLELAPAQKLSVSGENVEIKPKQGAVVKANQIQIEGISLKVKASAMATVESSGILQLKGSMMKLNG